MKIQILTLFPEFFDSCFKTGLLRRAIQNSILKFELADIKKFGKKGRADDYPFGGGDGMLIGYQPLKQALQSFSHPGHVVCLSAQGEKWRASKARSFAKEHKILSLVCGRYGGLDARFSQDFADEEISLGDYVLNGGETAAMAVIESLSRFLPGFLGNRESPEKESFENSLLEAPGWTRPREIKGHKIPELIFSGNHEEIKKLRFQSSLVLTWLKRPDLLEGKEGLLSQIPSAKKALSLLPKEELKALGFIKKEKGLALFQPRKA